MSVNRPLLFGLIALTAMLSGCNAWQNRTEFAPPQSRWPVTEPAAVASDAPPPAIRVEHCYRTLAVIDCFADRQPDRLPAYTGDYPEE
jgi:hypothetical protein